MKTVHGKPEIEIGAAVLAFNDDGQKFLAYYPLPTGSVIAGDNYQKNVNNTTNYDSYLGRVDYNLRPQDTLYGAYESTNPGILQPTFSATSLFNYINIQTAKNAYVQETHTFNPSTLNVARFGYNDSSIFYSTAGTGTADFVTQFGIQNLDPVQAQYAPPAVTLTTHTGLGSPTSPQGTDQRLYDRSIGFSIPTFVKFAALRPHQKSTRQKGNSVRLRTT